MKLFKLSAVAAAVVASTAAMAAEPVVVVDTNDNTVTTYQAVPAYEYNPDAGVVRNTTGAIVGTTRTLFDTVTHPAAVSAEIGTLGYGANIGWGLNESTELQAGWSGANFDGDGKLNSNDSWINWEKALGDGYENFKGDYKYDVKMSNPYLGVQMRPMKNWFTVGAGVIVPDNNIETELTAKDSSGNMSPVSIDGVQYNIADGSTIKAKVENKNKLAPFATIGFRPNITDKWGVFAEAGAAYMGDVKADVNVTKGLGVVSASKDGAPVAATNSDFEKAAENKLNDNDSVWYPIVKVGATYRF
ncbi:MAG: hypothetical protein Q4P13_06620 [Psychrobacter sp.]|nr:hypothetical protein [Psychrobacter sp.]